MQSMGKKVNNMYKRYKEDFKSTRQIPQSVKTENHSNAQRGTKDPNW